MTTTGLAALAGAAVGLGLGPVLGRLVQQVLHGELTPLQVRRQAIGIALVTGALFALLAIRLGASVEWAAFCVLAAALVVLVAIDLREQRLPREIGYGALALGSPLLVVAALVASEPRRIGMMALGAAIATALMGVIFLVSRGGMGEGDVRLAPVLGAYLGWLNPALVIAGLFIGFVVGAVVGVLALLAGRAGRHTMLPFGPFLAAGTLIAVLAEPVLINAMSPP